MTQTQTEPGALETVRRIIFTVTAVPTEQVSPEKRFLEDLDVDSLSVVEIAVAIQEELGVLVPDEELVQLTTVQDFISRIETSR
ncbi:acyl carrier protein [Sphaerisporangium corydalis]|uniref:Acyl carrier protein n=1 Tax=Sphaerisporangium corydalis TaxID=1441875 RepID=A0ABV9EDD7_9ACTN|nr:acyl carrier protein [Sphaerisporangium corydalis]